MFISASNGWVTLGMEDSCWAWVGEGAETQEGRALSGAAFSKPCADLKSYSAWRRTWRSPSSSRVRRRKAARRLVRFEIMGRAHTAEWLVMSSGTLPSRRLQSAEDRQIRSATRPD